MIGKLRLVLGPEHQRDYTVFLAWATAYAVLSGLSVSLLVPIASSLADGDYPATWRWLAVLAVLAAATAVAYYVQAMKGFNVALVVLRTMHLNIGDHLVTLPLGWFTGKTGSVAQIAAKGTIAIGGAAAHLMTPLVVSVVAPATVVVCMIAFDWRLGLALLISVPFLAVSSRLAMRLMARNEQATHDATVTTSDRVIEFAQCQPALRAFGRTGGERGYAPLEEAIAGQQRAVRRELTDVVSGLTVQGLAVQLVFSVVVVLAALLAQGGSITGIEFVALVGVAARFVQPVNEIAEFGGALRLIGNQLDRVQEVMDARPLPEAAEPVAVMTPGTIEFDHVAFGYESGDRVLDDVTFTVPAGTMTALVGPSGSGKTTIGRLIARFYDVDRGTVRVGGVDVRDQRAEDLMAQLALVFQDVYLFDDTLRANVRVGNRLATEDEVDEAARLAGVIEIVERLPRGWDTRVGEGGTALSGGERQRVSIARALLKRAPIVVLDEATAALDPVNERFVQESIDALRGRSTLLVIAHRLQTVMGADQILVLDDAGRVAERGTHDELAGLGGRYAAFWHERSAAAGWRLVGPRASG